MKITNKIKFAAVTLLLLAGSVNQALAQDWSSGEVYSLCGSSYSCVNFNYLKQTNHDNGWSTSAGYASDIGYYIKNEGVAGTKSSNRSCRSISYHSYTKAIPSYCKLVRQSTFTLALYTDRDYKGLSHGCGLYFFDNAGVGRNTDLDASYDQGYTFASSNLICKFYTESSTKGIVTRTTNSSKVSMIWDNQSGSTEQNIEKLILFMHSARNTNSSNTLTGYDRASWNETVISESWSYYKYITFDANGGTGAAMAVQTVQSNDQIPSITTLNTNTYTRPGYKFTGWNTQADGMGTAYTNGQMIDASSSDKGPVTLYAQWAVDVTVTETGTSIFFDKNVVVPAGVEVYGFTYSDGVLVQSEKISEGAILPANNGYLVKVTKAGIFNFTATKAAATVPGSDIIGTTTEIDTPSETVYVWGKPEGYNYGWYKYTRATIPAGKAYFVTSYIKNCNKGGINDMKINNDEDF